MKVYLVVIEQGEYSDYSMYVHKAFKSEKAARKCIEDITKEMNECFVVNMSVANKRTYPNAYEMLKTTLSFLYEDKRYPAELGIGDRADYSFRVDVLKVEE